MLIDISRIVPPITGTGVVHVGAHYGQEYSVYKRMGIPKVVFIEPCQQAFGVLQSIYGNFPDVTLVNTACGNSRGIVMMNVERSNEGQSNSLLEMGTHLQQHPGIKFVDKEPVSIVLLDDLALGDLDILVIDVQGYELEVLKGGSKTLEHINYIYTEVNREEVYKGCARIEEVDEILADFTRIKTSWVGGWGDALYKRIGI